MTRASKKRQERIKALRDRIAKRQSQDLAKVKFILIGSANHKVVGHVSTILKDNGVHFYLHGSRCIGISVASFDVRRAVEILIQDAERNRYKISLIDIA